MKSFSPAGAATKAFFGLGARTFGNPDGATRGGGAYAAGGNNPNGPNQGGGPSSGITWTAQGAIAAGDEFSVGYGDGIFIASNGATTLSRSADQGGTWPITHALSFNNVAIVGDGTGVWLAAGGVSALNEAHVARSTDLGLTWVESNVFPVSTVTDAIATDGLGTWIALRGEGGVTGGRVRVSNDGGATWPGLSAFHNVAWFNNAAIFVNPSFIALGIQAVTNFPTVNQSTDGLTWVETVLDNTGTDSFNSIGYDPILAKYIVGLSSSPAVRVSSTIAGLATAPDVSTGLTDVCSFVLGTHGTFFAFSFSGEVASSTNGTVWSTGTLNFAAGNSARSAAFNPVTREAVAVGDGGDVSTVLVS